MRAAERGRLRPISVLETTPKIRSLVCGLTGLAQCALARRRQRPALLAHAGPRPQREREGSNRKILPEIRASSSQNFARNRVRDAPLRRLHRKFRGIPMELGRLHREFSAARHRVGSIEPHIDVAPRASMRDPNFCTLRASMRDPKFQVGRGGGLPGRGAGLPGGRAGALSFGNCTEDC